MNDETGKTDFREIYDLFSSPLMNLDCGQKCGPYNDYGVPVCCDINLVIPAAYADEWEYLRKATELWRPWGGLDGFDADQVADSLQEGAVLIQCLGYKECQRDFRSITCRSFPFFPYLDSTGSFIGLAYYSDFQDQCWVISNLQLVDQGFKSEFQLVYQELFRIYPEVKAGFQEFSAYVRDQFHGRSASLVVLAFTGELLLVDPGSEKITRGDYSRVKKFGPFEAARDLKFPDETD